MHVLINLVCFALVNLSFVSPICRVLAYETKMNRVPKLDTRYNILSEMYLKCLIARDRKIEERGVIDLLN